MKATLVRLSVEGVPPELREPLLGWLSGFAHHWPAEFEEHGGPAARGLLRTLEREEIDRNRYLKFRRIAIANLAASRGAK